jgi:hypothetical protein
VVGHILGPIFISFFERYNVWLRETYGDGVNWHPTLNFARVVRNSAAHGGINFRNPGAPSVSWKQFTYGPSDNGRQVIGPDLSLGEMLALMFECSDELDALNAPVL